MLGLYCGTHWGYIGVILWYSLGLYRGYIVVPIGVISAYIVVPIGVIISGLYWDDGKENGNCRDYNYSLISRHSMLRSTVTDGLGVCLGVLYLPGPPKGSQQMELTPNMNP